MTAMPALSQYVVDQLGAGRLVEVGRVHVLVEFVVVADQRPVAQGQAAAEIVLDGGVRRGSDVVKALTLYRPASALVLIEWALASALF